MAHCRRKGMAECRATLVGRDFGVGFGVAMRGGGGLKRMLRERGGGGGRGWSTDFHRFGSITSFWLGSAGHLRVVWGRGLGGYHVALMIYDILQNAGSYYSLSPRIAAAFRFLVSPKARALGPGKHSVDG